MALLRGIALLYQALKKGKARKTESRHLSRVEDESEQRQIDNAPVVSEFMGWD